VQVDFDLKGNIYYAVQPTTNTSAQVMKISGQTETVFANGFFKGFQQIRNLQVVDDKVYITALTSNEKTVSKISLFVSK
jgi:DNA-binding beta-propeller fold protein YncE